MSRDIYYLHFMIFWICVLVVIVIFGVLIYISIKHRKSTGHSALQFHPSLTAELLWTIIPFIILIAMAVPATVMFMRMEDTSNSASVER